MGMFSDYQMEKGQPFWATRKFNPFLAFLEGILGLKAPLAHGHDGSTGTVALVVCTSGSRPASPTLGMVISETDTGLAYKCTSTSPVVWAPLGTVDTLLVDTGTALNTYVLTPSPAKTAYSSDDTYFIKPRGASTTRTCSVVSARKATVTNNSAVVSFTQGTTTGLAVGMGVSGTGISGKTIQSVDSPTQITLSGNATASNSNVELTFTKVITCTISSNTAFAVTSGNTTDVLPGMPISGTGIPAGCLVQAVTDGAHFTSSLTCAAGTGISVTVTIPVIEATLDSGNTTGLTQGWRVDGSLIVRDTIISSIVDSTHLKLSAVPGSGSAQALSFNTGQNTGACAVNVSGLGAKSIKLADGTDPLSGQIRAAGVYMLKYDGTDLVLLNPSLPSGLVGSTTYGGVGTYTWTQGVDCPSWVTRIYSEVWGGGGAGGNGGPTYAGAGGGGGGFSSKWIPVSAGQQITITVGAGGAAASNNGGGTSSTGSHHSATGGGGGTTGYSYPASGGAAGAGVGGDNNIAGTAGAPNTGNGYGGAGANGGAGGAGWANNQNGGPGLVPGGGGGGGNAAWNGGAGAAGLVRIQW